MELPPTNNERLLENFVNKSHTLLRQRLQPLCLLHLLWLEYIGSPFVQTSRPVVLADVELAALICSSSSSEEILSKLSAKKCGLWKRIAAKSWQWRNRGTDITEACKAFIAYQDDYCSLPDFATDGKESHERLPYILLQAAALIKETGWDESKVFTLPVGKVVWYNVAFGYLRSGETGVVSDRERQAMALLTGRTV